MQRETWGYMMEAQDGLGNPGQGSALCIVLVR